MDLQQRPPKNAVMSIRFGQVPLVLSWTIPADAICKVGSKTIDPQSNYFSAGNDTACGQHVLNISRTQRQAVVGPHSIGDDLAGKTEAFQAGHISWYISDTSQTARSRGSTNG